MQQPKRNNFRHTGDTRFRIKTTQSGHLCSPKRKGRNGTSKNCRRRYLDTAEEDYQEEARKRKVGKKEKKTKKANKGRRKMRIEEGIRSSQRMAFERQNPTQRWDRSQIENEEEESSQEGDQMAGQ